MRLTSQTITNAPIVINPEGKLTLQLRQLQIPYIENLGITQDKFDTIDLTDNELLELDGIPNGFTNLHTLLLANNFITKISDTFPENNITSLSLINNNFKSFDWNFTKFKKLETLCLNNNPLCSINHYRLFIIWLIPSLKVLDFQKIKQKERVEANELFGDDYVNLNELALSLLNNTQVLPDKMTQVQTVVKKLTAEEKKELLFKLKAADSIDEIARIEATLKQGYV